MTKVKVFVHVHAHTDANPGYENSFPDIRPGELKRFNPPPLPMKGEPTTTRQV